MRSWLAILIVVLGVSAPIAEALAGCPAGYTQSGNRCVRYSCRPGCTYVGNGMCRCRR
jgi:hypothetical protein